MFFLKKPSGTAFCYLLSCLGAGRARLLVKGRQDGSQGWPWHRWGSVPPWHQAGGAGQVWWQGQVSWQCCSSGKCMVTGQVWGSPGKSSQWARAARHRAGHRHACKVALARNRTGEQVRGRVTCSKVPKGAGAWAQLKRVCGPWKAGGGPRWGCTKQQKLVGTCRALAYTTYLLHQHFYLNSEAKKSCWTTVLTWGWQFDPCCLVIIS